jgi:diguanylate cyclase (GGDEF)-like protein
VDRLKSLNDQFGHLTGAEAVRTVGHIIGRHLPPDAVACRYGGDEFVIAIPHCTPFLARQIADNLCRAVRDTEPVLSGRWFKAGTLSISVGASWTSFDRSSPQAIVVGDVEAGESLFRAADTALYRAKASGRNRVNLV